MGKLKATLANNQSSFYSEITVDDKATKAALKGLKARGNKALKNAYADIGEYMLNSTRARWKKGVSPAGSAWAKLAKRTILRKKKNKDKILIHEGFMYATLAYRATPHGLELGVNRIGEDGENIAERLHFGDPAQKLPARPFLGVSKEDEQEIKAIIRDHFALIAK